MACVSWNFNLKNNVKLDINPIYKHQGLWELLFGSCELKSFPEIRHKPYYFQNVIKYHSFFYQLKIKRVVMYTVCLWICVHWCEFSLNLNPCLTRLLGTSSYFLVGLYSTGQQHCRKATVLPRPCSFWTVDPNTCFVSLSNSVRKQATALWVYAEPYLLSPASQWNTDQKQVITK